MLITEDRRLEMAAVEPLAHARHLGDEIAVADADFGAVEVHARTQFKRVGQIRSAGPFVSLTYV